MKLNWILLSAAVIGCTIFAGNAAYECYTPSELGMSCDNDSDLYCIEADKNRGKRAIAKIAKLQKKAAKLDEQLDDFQSQGGSGLRASPCSKAMQNTEKKLARINKSINRISSNLGENLAQCRDILNCEQGTLLATEDETGYLNQQCWREKPGSDKLECLSYLPPPIGEKPIRDNIKCMKFFSPDA